MTILAHSDLERRNFERFDARFPAKFKDTREDYGIKVYLRNASAQGANLLCKDRLYLHDSVSLDIKLPDHHDAMPIRGEVVWVKKVNTQFWDIGLKFYKIDLMHVSRLYKFIEPHEV